MKNKKIARIVVAILLASMIVSAVATIIFSIIEK